MRPFPLPPRTLSRVLQGVAALGLVAALLGTVAAWGLLGQAETALEDSLRLTGDTLAALDASAGVAADSVAALGSSLGALGGTAATLEVAFDDGQRLLVDLADLVRRDVVQSLTAVDDALPGLIRVAGTIDSTLSALSRLPFGPSYDPEESFADALRTLSVSLDGLPGQLREQADLIEVTAGSLDDAGEGIVALLDDIAGFEQTLDSTEALLATYTETITEGQALVTEAGAGLGGRITFARVAVVLLGLAFAALQVVPLQLAASATSTDPADGP